MNRTEWFEEYSKWDIQHAIDNFCQDHEVVSVSITETQGPEHYLAVVLYRDVLDQALEVL